MNEKYKYCARCEIERGEVPVEYIKNADFWPEHSCREHSLEDRLIPYLYLLFSISTFILGLMIMALAIKV